MAVIETWIKTDLKSIVKVNMFHGILFSQDNMANLIGVELLDGGEPATVTGSVSANVLRADGTTVAVAGTLSGNKASVTLPQAAYAVPGMLAIVIKLTDSSTVTTIGAIQSIVYRASTDTIIDPGTIIPSVQDLIAAIEDAVESIPPDYSELTGEVSDLKNAFNDLDDKLYETVDRFQMINLSSTSEISVTPYTDKNGNVADTGISSAPRNIQMQALSGFTSYSFRPTTAMELYCEVGSANYYSLSYLENPVDTEWQTSGTTLIMVGSASVRYRNSESNLPTANNPLTIPAGSQVVVTVTSGASPIIYWKQSKKASIIKAQNLGEKYPFISVEMHADYIYYYMPTNTGNWLRYKFNHYVNQSTNANGWVQRNVNLVSADKETVIFPVITEGEWEMAIQLEGRPDFIGCQNHGSEVSTIVSFLFDGVEKAITDGTAFDCASIKVIEKSTMYDPNDETTIVGYHYKTYEITTDGIKIHQRIEWITDNTAMKSYVMMIPAVRGNDSTSTVQVTDRAYDDYHMVICNVATTTFNPTDVSAQNYKGNALCLYGTTSGIAITGECTIKNPSTSVFAFLSNATYYNKWYYGYCGDNYPITSGDVWEWDSVYKITYNE